MTASLATCCAGLYDLDITRLLLGDSFHPGGAALTRRLGGLALLHRGVRVLDVASGRGATGAELQRHFGCRVVGLDYSMPGARSSGGVRGDAHHLPFAGGSFDALVCECALCTFEAMESCAREMFRVLRPGGRVAIADMVRNAPVPEELRGLFPRVLCIAGARSRDGYLDVLRGAGFAAPRAYDESRALLDMIAAIEKRLATLDALGEVAMPSDLGDPRPALEAARRFVTEGGLGYGLFVAQRPR